MKMNRLSLVAALVLGGLVAGSQSGLAQDSTAPKRPERRGLSAQQQVDRMATELKLTEDQKTKLVASFEELQKKRQELFSDNSLTPEQRREKMRPLMEEHNKKFKEILTPEQLEKWQKMRAQRRPAAPGGSPGQKKAPEKKAE